MTDAIPAELVAAYSATLYEVLGDLSAVISITDTAGAHDPWLTQNNSQTAVVITAWNPFSEQMAPAINAAANIRLQMSIETRKLHSAPAQGRHPLGEWSEESVCVFDVSDELLDSWLIDYRQNAAIRVRLGEQPQLVWHRSLSRRSPM